MRIVVLGYMVRGPIGGMAWSDLHYLLGLRHLGLDVYFLEDSHDFPMCYDPGRNETGTDPTYGLAFAARIFEENGFENRWAYYDAHRTSWSGPRAADAVSICESADIVLNLGGVNPLRDWTRAVRVRVLVDKDPVFTQIRNLTDAYSRALAQEHNRFFTYGESYGAATSRIPDDGLPWCRTRHPVFLTAWPALEPAEGGSFTTVMQWDSYPAREHDGVRYGMKSESFGPYARLPRATDQRLELAVGGSSVPREELIANGWVLSNPLEVAREPDDYRRYIRASKGELTVAKHGYVMSNSGWFSERTASYLASGRPAIVQETGFSRWLPTGSGVVSFSDPEEAAEALRAITGDYRRHCRDARALAEEYFDSRKVLTDLLERCGGAPSLGVAQAESAEA